ncbi:hypothetical protein ACOZ4N_12710 [Halorientalis pallida]|uniref:hypothetical protein n=1 Tax=Halorientalis pallida TaxID=2479928 RepID=UPI003C6EC116
MRDISNRILAVLFTFLMVVGSFAPVVQAVPGGTYQAIDRGPPSQVEQENRTAIGLKTTALAYLTGLGVDEDETESDDPNVSRPDPGDLDRRDWNETERDVPEPVTTIRETLGTYRGPDRVESESVFRDDARALQQLSGYATSDPFVVDEASWRVARADARTANTSIEDAQRAWAVFGDAVDNPGQRRKIQRKLTNAERAYERGQDALGGQGRSVETAAKDRARAIRHFATAWRHSQHALDTLAKHTEPRVRIRTRADPIRNGSTATDRTLLGQVQAVRPWGLDDVTIRVGENRTTTVSTMDGTRPAGNATFIANVTLEDRRVNVTAALGDTEPNHEIPEVVAQYENEEPAGNEREVRYPNRLVATAIRAVDARAAHAVGWDVGTDDESSAAGDTLQQFTVEYADGVNLSAVTADSVGVYVDTDADIPPEVNVSDDVRAVSVDDHGTTLSVTLDGNYTLAPEDYLLLTYRPVVQGSEPGEYPVRVSLNGGADDERRTGTLVLEDYTTSEDPTEPNETEQSDPDSTDTGTDEETDQSDGSGGNRTATSDEQSGELTGNQTASGNQTSTGSENQTTPIGNQTTPTGNKTTPAENQSIPDGNQTSTPSGTETVTDDRTPETGAEASVGPRDSAVRPLRFGEVAIDSGRTVGQQRGGPPGQRGGSGPPRNGNKQDDTPPGHDKKPGKRGKGNGKRGKKKGKRGDEDDDEEGDHDSDDEDDEEDDDDSSDSDDAPAVGVTPDLPQRDTVLFDGDGLRDTYELEVTGTNPLYWDSNATAIAGDRGGDGLLDGEHDFDDDSLQTLTEQFAGTDPFSADTDDDGLTDAEERSYVRLSATDADSDDDGTPDGAADPDGDGLSTAEEIEAGTDPFTADTDTDDLDDGAEVTEYGTEALTPDTDGDGLLDGEEIRLGTDPLVADSDGDGVPDGEESYTTTATDDATNVSVTVSGEGDVASTVEIAPKPTFFADSGVRAGPTVRLRNRSAFESATVRLPINESVPESEYEDLAVYKWNGSANDTWHQLETAVNNRNGTATATVGSFSYFTVIDTDEWVNLTTAKAQGTVGNATGDPIAFESQSDFSCQQACTITNETSLVLGGEPTTRKIVAEQAGETYEIVPLQNDQSITEFYNYGNNEINSPIELAESDKSQLFFWSGPEGLSLVALHDKPDDGSGGAVDLGFSGLPFSDGEWVVRDDPPDFDRGSRTRPHWTWNDIRTDGGAFRGGLRNQTITVTPYFNDAASEEPITSGSIDAWQLLVGKATDPRKEQLDMDEPVTLRIPSAPSDSGESNETAGDTGSASWTYSLADSDTDQLTLLYKTEQTAQDPSVEVVASDDAGNTVRQQLNIGTAGTVQEPLNLTGLSGDEVTIEASADGVDLKIQFAPVQTASSGQDTDGDGIPDYIEKREWVLPAGSGERFSTSPYDADTDGDGIDDGAEVTFEQVGGSVVIENAVANPTEYDSDGDGLSDYEEHEEGWTVEYTTDRGEAETAAKQTTADDVEGLEDRTVYSDPLAEDTDGDGVDDFDEFTNRTDPTREYTVDDGLGDAAAFDVGQDPTLHDYTGPEVSNVHISTELYFSMPKDLLQKLEEYGIRSLEFIRAIESMPQRIIDRITAWRLDRKLGTLLSLGQSKIQEIASWNANKIGTFLSIANSGLEKFQQWGSAQWSAFSNWSTSQIAELQSWGAGDILALGEEKIDAVRGVIGEGADAIGNSISDFRGFVDSVVSGVSYAGDKFVDTVTFGYLSASMMAGAGVTTPVRTRASVAAGSQSPHVLTPAASTSAGGAAASVSGGSAAATPDFDVPDEIDPLASEYRITFAVTDPSGVGEVVLKKGDNTNTVQFGGGCQDATCRTTATLLVDSPITGALETLTGEKATIIANDVHGNENSGEYFSSNVYGELAKQVASAELTIEELDITLSLDQRIGGYDPIAVLAVFSGLSHAIGKSIQGLIQLVKNPSQILALIDLAKAIVNDFTVIGSLITGALGSIQQAQRRHNPFDRSNTLSDLTSGNFGAITEIGNTYNRFAVGWYAGYVGGFIVEAIAGSKGATKVKNVIRANSKIGSKALDAAGKVRAATLGRAESAAARAGIRVARGLRSKAPELDATAVRRALSNSATTTKQRVAAKFRNLDSATRTTINEAGIEQPVARYLAETRGDGDFLDQLDSDDLKALFPCSSRRGAAGSAALAMTAGVTASAAGTVATQSGGACDVDRDGFPDLGRDLSAAVRRGDLTETKAKNFLDEVTRLSDSGAGELSRLLKNDAGTRYRLIKRYGDGDVTDANLQRIDELLDSGDMDRADVQRMLGMLESKETNPLIDGDLKSEELLDIAERGGLSETIGAVQRGGRTISIPEGNRATGWNHVVVRHVEGTYRIDAEGGTSLFPTGASVRGTNLPDSLSKSKVQRLIYDGIKQGDETTRPNGAKYYFEPVENGYPDSGVDDMRIIVEDGTVDTAYPLSGDDVLRYVPDLNDGAGGFVETK